MKDLVFDVTTQEMKWVTVSEEEQAQRELDRLAAEEEASKPKPPTLEEQIEDLEVTTAEYMIDLDFRLSTIELGL